MIKKIYHLADLHIRNLRRHREYKEVFDKFLDEVREKDLGDEAVIYLAGDIAHAKTDLSPELVKMISWFFTECAKLHDTFVITGNHDCNLNNDYRLDALTPIVENLNNDKLHYLRDTGVYEHENLTFVVYSILDHKDNWPKGTEVEGDNKICLFHGPVNKSTTDVGYTVTSNSFTVDMFDGFHMAMLGDIHKRQQLQGYDPVKGKPIIMYAGSMVQQNHGELLEKHGYLLWDVETRTFTEHHIHNDYGYLTIDVKDGEVPQWVYDEVDTKLPKSPRMRLRFSGTTNTDMKRIVTELKKMFAVSEVTVTRTDTLRNIRTNNNLNDNIVGNVNDTTFQNKLIRDYLETQYLLEDDLLDKVTDLNTDINSRVKDTKVAENIVWYPKKFEFSNMFSYGEDNKIRFDKAQGMMGIFAPNASGKSSLFDALSFCIFDKSARTYVSKNILNNRKDNFYCKFHFTIDDIDFFIERIGKTVNKGKHVKVDVNFWKEEGGTTTSLNGEQRRDTNRIIQEYLGTYEDFVLTALSLQGNNALFIDKSQSERKDILAQFIGVDIFDKLYTEAHEQNKENRTLIKKFKKDDFTTKLANIETELDTKQKEYKIAENQLNAYKKEEDELNKKLVRLNEKIVSVNSDLEDIDIMTEKKKEYAEKRKDIKQSISDLHSKIQEMEERQIELEEILDEFDEDDLKEGVKKFREYEKSLSNVNSTISTTKVRLENLKERKEHLDTHEYNPDCDICMKNSESILKTKEEVVEEINELNQTLVDLEKEKVEHEDKLNKYKSYDNDMQKYSDTKAKENKIDREITNSLNKISQYERDHEKYTNLLDKQNGLIDEYYKNEEQIKKNKEIRSDIKEVRSSLSDVKSNIKKSNKAVLDINGRVSSLENQIENIQERIDEVKELEDQHEMYEYYLNALSRDGVSYELISKALPMIEGEVNNILSQIVDFGMQFEMDEKNINANIVYEDQSWSLEMCSGMEKFISGLAIRIALINVCNLPRPNFLVVDEGFGTLDPENLTSLYMLFSYLKTQFDFVMIISHIDSMRDAVDNLIEIKKDNGFSKVKL